MGAIVSVGKSELRAHFRRGNGGVRCGRDRAGHHPCKHLALESGTLAPPIGLRHSVSTPSRVRRRSTFGCILGTAFSSRVASGAPLDRTMRKMRSRSSCHVKSAVWVKCARARMDHARARVAICTLAMSSAGCTDTMEVSLDADESPALGGQRSAIVCPVCSSAVHLVVSSPAEKSTQVGRGRCRLVTARQGK